MYVRNRVGFNFAFMYRGYKIVIPYDGKIYSIPNDCPKFTELQIILPMNVRTQEVIYIKVDGSVGNFDGHKRRGRPTKNKKKKYKSFVQQNTKIENNEINTDIVEENKIDNHIVNIDLSTYNTEITTSGDTIELDVVDTDVEVENNDTPKKKRGRPKGSKNKKKRGRPKGSKTKSKGTKK